MDCLFCDIAAGARAAHMVCERERALAFLDTRPLFKGHVLVVPREHHETLAALPAEQVPPLFDLVRQLSAAVVTACGAQGSLVLANNGVSQSVPHLHVHVVPRTRGDGLRGFLWPRHRYASAEEAAEYAARVRRALDDLDGAAHD